MKSGENKGGLFFRLVLLLAKFVGHPKKRFRGLTPKVLTFFLLMSFVVTANATPPRYFDKIEVSVTPDLDFQKRNIIAVKLDGPNPRNDGVMITCFGQSGIEVGEPDKSYSASFPATFLIPVRLVTQDIGILEIIITPTRGKDIRPPLKKLYKVIRWGTSLVLEEFTEEELEDLTSNYPNQLTPTRAIADIETIIEKTYSVSEPSPSPEKSSPEDLNAVTLPGTITVQGYWKYRDNFGVDYPIRYAKVEVYDSDPLGPNLLRSGYTDSSGYYSFSGITNDDGLFQGGLDIFVRIHCDYGRDTTKGAYVTDGNIFNITYWSETTIKDNVADGIVNMGTWVVTDSQKRGSWGIYHAAITTYEYFKNTSPSWDNPKLLCKWPVGSWPQFKGFPWLGIIYEMQIPSGWEWDKGTIYHEYSHSVMFKTYGNFFPATSHGGENHSYGDEKDEGFALIEGWAEFCEELILGSTFFDTNRWADSNDQNDYDGEIVEGAVAEVLWDIADGGSSDDDGVPSKLTYLMYILPTYKPSSILDIKSRWSQIGYSYQTELQNIYYAAKIDQPPSLSVSLSANPSSGTAPLSTNLTADVSGTAAGTINYTFWWNCNDPGTSVSAVTSVCGNPWNSTYGAKFDGVWDDPKVVNHVYSSGGNYTPKVIAERGTAPPAEKRATITVYSCTYSISPTSRSHGSGAESGSVSVTTQSGCSWSASSNANWITITSGSSGTGNGTVYYSVSANTSTSSRTGTMTIAGQTFTVYQSGTTCTYSISPTSRSHSSGAESGTVSVTAQSGCSWAATSNVSWITITSGSSGTGSGTVYYSVSANTSTSSRTGTITIAGQTFTVSQSGAGGNGTATRNLPDCYTPSVSLSVTIAVTPTATTQTYALEETPPNGWTISNINENGQWDNINKKVKWGPFFDHNNRTLTYKATPPSGETGSKTFSGTTSFDGASVAISGESSIEKCVSRPHPADTNNDYRMGINEATAYGSAWKTGQTWPTPPNPIPVEYVTNAGYLWKMGEVYHYDGSVYPPWVSGAASVQSITRQLSLQIPIGSETGRAIRTLPSTSEPSVPVNVSISVNPAQGTQVFAAEETPPSGWVVTDINESGQWDSVSKKVKWGPFFDDNIRTLTYKATPPVGETGMKTFSGTVSFDGQNVSIGGD